MANHAISRNEFVNATCLDGLEILEEFGLVFLSTPTYDIFADHSFGNGELFEGDINEESKETYSSKELVSSWSDKIRFDVDGFVTSLDLGGRRLYRGLPFDAAVFGTEFFPRLTTLNLAGTDLPVKDILAILSHIEATIECLYLGGNGLGSKGARAIASSGLFHQSGRPSRLNKLDLRYNDIGDFGMEAISNALMNKTNTEKSESKNSDDASAPHNCQNANVVQFLYLEGNNIGDRGCAALSELLSSKPLTDECGGNLSCCRIQEVFLGANRIGPEGAECIASALRVNKTISKIYLEGNSLGAQGAAAFCQVLEELNGETGLKHLYVDNNNIGKELSNRLAQAMRSDTVIEEISS
jgi:Ran GTPase-activating protein (RanGAP) involved in mRNA processing and transport